ncbi:MAG TPA: tRNA (adenine(22)-N(1))-methyltransferase TrmK, partial [Thermaerobacter sp.]
LAAVGRAAVLADVGTDHGYLPAAAILRGQARRAIATDRRRAPLEAARRVVRAAGIEDAVELRQGAGLEPLAPGEADAVVIAGLHGKTIAAILREGATRLVPGTRLVLQPTRGADALRLPALAVVPPGAVLPPPLGAVRSGGAPSPRPPAIQGRRPPLIELEGEGLATEGRHTYVVIRGRVVGRGFPCPGGPAAATGGTAPNPPRPEDERGFVWGASDPLDEPAFLWLWDRATSAAAFALASLAHRTGVDPHEAVARVGPALLVAERGGPHPHLAQWLDELGRPWRRALRMNQGSTPRAMTSRQRAAAWLAFLREVGRLAGVEADRRAGVVDDRSAPTWHGRGRQQHGMGSKRQGGLRVREGPWRLHTDGAARGNPGPAGIGVVLIDPDGQVAERVARYIGTATNNVAEYRALIAGLERALAYGARRLEVYSDSELMVRQLNGEYRVKHEGLKPLYRQVRELVERFDAVRFIHVPRERNRDADRLANQGIDEGCDPQ